MSTERMHLDHVPPLARTAALLVEWYQPHAERICCSAVQQLRSVTDPCWNALEMALSIEAMVESGV